MSTETFPLADIQSLLPLHEGEDLPVKLASLASLLRATPLTPQGMALFDQAEKALAEIPTDFLNADHALCLLFLSRRTYYAGNAHAGLITARRAVALAKRLENENLRARALTTLGTLYLEAGTYPDTVSTLTAALDAARAAGDRFQEVQILGNLGVAHQYAGHFGAAVPCYERAVELAEAHGIGASPQGAALGNLVLAHIHLRDFKRGIETAQRAVGVLASPANVAQRAVRCLIECYFARVLLESGDLDRARERVALAHEFASDTGELSQVSADMAQGFLDVHEPTRRDIGLSRLQRCVDASRKGAPGALRDALSLIVRGFEIAGQPNAALVYLHEIVHLNGENRVKNVLTYHHMHLEQIREALDVRASSVLQDLQRELRFKRMPIDVLRECMLVLERNTVAAELHDDDTGEHCYRMGALARELARRAGMDDEMASLIDLSARLHDIGKLRVPDSILLKPGRLNPDERAIMQSHCVHGWDVIGQGGMPQLFVAQEIALNHHERWDGTGYPNGRAGALIPLAARITALADVFDALTHRRCYKEAWSVDQSLREISSLRGTQFDPTLVDLFLQMIPELQAEHRDLDAYLGAEARKNDFVADRARLASILKSQAGPSS
jgi:putative two-component system response regulator